MKKVALLGGVSHWSKAPFNDDTFEIWALNDMFEILPRFDRLFEVHTFEHINQYMTRYKNKNYLQGLSRLEVPVYLQDVHPEIKTSIKYPLQEMTDKFGGYFTSTVSYMCALAIHEGYNEIHFYGINMSTGTEYGDQKAGAEYFIGIMKGIGIKVYITPESDLLKAYYLYGYDQKKYDPFIEKCLERKKYLEKQESQTKKQIQDLQMQLYRTEGALQDIEHILLVYGG